ncbi:MAG: hypothetical protein JWM80_4938 [Cyanobacteria bacterium RYN_339]|nr:hypothetical protein [Cyanobacteria bacterium RYN_339]
MRLAGLVAAAALVAGCYQDPDPFPYGITSLAVLPADVQPGSSLAGRLAGDHLTQLLMERTVFRVVGIDSTSRILNAPEGVELYRRFRSMAKTSGVIEGPVARTIGNRLGVQGLLYPRLALALSGPVSGKMSLTLTVYEANQGFRVWQGYSQRGFAGNPGEPAFNKTLGQLVEDVVSHMPRPAGEGQ